ncbi:MAG: methyltransferase domain-containing protein [Prolixibacteraceae bacterium]|nr:methyltransferase domain-containing protein [Prolixibacteraceae bacterium]
MQHVLEHFENPFDTLESCHRLLNKNGILIVLVPNSKYRKATIKRSGHRFYSIEGVGSEHFTYFNYANLEKTLIASGFKVVQQNYPVFTRQIKSFIFYEIP